MLDEKFSHLRKKKHSQLEFDFVILGGGMTGICAAIAAARRGVKVALIQDRPILGGNGSSEVRVWMLGATSHMGNNNRWAREGGIVDEILVENTYRNKEGNPYLFDMVLMDKVLAEKNISLFLNTVVYDIVKKDDRNVSALKGYNSQNETEYTFSGKYFCDASGDGLLAYLAGARYRIGAEDEKEFDEKFAQDPEEYGDMLGHTLFFYTKMTPNPVMYKAPDFAMTKEEVVEYIGRIHNPNYFNPTVLHGCKYWWIEYGGRLNTIHDTEEIKYKLWEVAYGLWDYIKNSGNYPEAANMTLEWVGSFPGKRETRRFVGPYMIHQKDVIEQRSHYDAVAFGGWSIDLHPADGVFSDKNGCNQWHSKGVFQIPYRCYVTEDLDNVFISGRLISASHVAYGATRVMLTNGIGGEVVGTAASLCLANNYTTLQVADEDKVKMLQKALIEAGNYIPQFEVKTSDNLLLSANIKASSELALSEIPFEGGLWKKLAQSAAQMLPAKKGAFPALTVAVKAEEDTELQVELRISSKYYNHTPDTTLEVKTIKVSKGEQNVDIKFETEVPYECYAFVCFIKNSKLELKYSTYRITGILSAFNKVMPDVSNWGKQIVTEDIGVEEFEFWCPERRPEGHNIAMKINPAIEAFGTDNIVGEVLRPVEKPNAWIAALDKKEAEITAQWEKEVEVKTINVFTDADFDEPMETVQWGHYDNRMPFCAENITIYDDKNNLIASVEGNYQTIVRFELVNPIKTTKLTFRVSNSEKDIPVSLFGIHVR